MLLLVADCNFGFPGKEPFAGTLAVLLIRILKCQDTMSSQKYICLAILLHCMDIEDPNYIVGILAGIRHF